MRNLLRLGGILALWIWISGTAGATWPTVQVEVLGEPEVVMLYRTDSCRAAGGLDRDLLRVQLCFTLVR